MTDSRHSIDMADKFAAQKEAIIFGQLKEIISRGLLVIVEGAPTLVRDMASNSVEYKQSITLQLKDQEYIVKLEKENKSMKDKLDAIKAQLTEALDT